MVSNINRPVIESQMNKKPKYKKNALDFVDHENEFKKDPKYKTELCTTFGDNGFCAYGNKCRFAHGREDLFDKHISHPKYRKSECLTFHADGFCNYGQRCHFRHNDTTKLPELNRSYFNFLLLIFSLNKRNNCKNRLKVFSNLSNKNNEIISNSSEININMNMNMTNNFPTNFNNFINVENNNNSNNKNINNIKRMIRINMNVNFNLNNVNILNKSNLNSRKMSENSQSSTNSTSKDYFFCQ